MTKEIRERLLSTGWSEIKSNCCYEKYNYELVFDTGTYVEIYDKSNGKRLLEGLVSELDNFLSELALIDKE
ncbi:MAG: hypothetical protein AAF391_01815 [Bacteroidota bacterium]